MDDSSPEKPSLTESPPSSSTEVLLEQVLIALQSTAAGAQVVKDNHQTLWDRVNWLLKLEASRADHVLQLTAAVQQQTISRDRQTETLTLCIQKLTEIYDQREHIRAGLDLLRQEIATAKAIDTVGKKVTEIQTDAGKKIAEAMVGAQEDASKKLTEVVGKTLDEADRKLAQVVVEVQAEAQAQTKKAIKKAVRDATGAQRTHEADALAERLDRGAWALRVLDRSSPSTKILVAILALLLSACFGGYIFLKVHEHTEAPQGAPIPTSRK